MGKAKYDYPTTKFPFKISHRLNMLCVPKKTLMEYEGMPAYSSMGVRQSALRSQLSYRVNEVAYPQLRRILNVKQLFRHRFSQQRLRRIDKIIAASNGTCYTKLANATIVLRKSDIKDKKKKKPWSDSDWRRHMEYIGKLATPKKDFTPRTVDRGNWKPLEELLPRIQTMCYIPEEKMWRSLSQETWYRDPVKVSSKALRYVISENIKKLATPRPIIL